MREARHWDEWAPYAPGCPWLLGLGRINYPTLSDLVTENEAGWEQRFVQRLQVLMHEGLADRERVTHEGTKIRAAAGRGSFKRSKNPGARGPSCYVKHNSAVWRLLCFHSIVAKLCFLKTGYLFAWGEMVLGIIGYGGLSALLGNAGLVRPPLCRR